MFAEYWGKPGATREAFRDGWFRTGDTAVVETGIYRILGRTSIDILKTGGHKVSALEIEEALREHPAVAECAVVGDVIEFCFDDAAHVRAPVFAEMKAVLGGAPGQRGADRSRSRLVVRSRAEDGVGVGDRPRIAPGDVLVHARRVDRLIVDARVDGCDPETAQQAPHFALVRHELRRLAQPLGEFVFDAGGVASARHAHAAAAVDDLSQVRGTGGTHDLVIAHQVDVADRDEARRAEKVAALHRRRRRESAFLRR